MREPKTLLVKTTGGAGLGDSIRALLAGLHYAAVSGRRLAVAWDDGLYGERGVDVFPELLRLVDVDVASLPELGAQSVRPAPWRGALHRSLGELYAALREDVWNRGWALKNLSFDQGAIRLSRVRGGVHKQSNYGRSWRTVCEPVGGVNAGPRIRG